MSGQQDIIDVLKRGDCTLKQLVQKLSECNPLPVNPASVNARIRRLIKGKMINAKIKKGRSRIYGLGRSH